METERLADFAAALRPRLSGDLRLDSLHRALYATDASLYRERQLGVLLPRHADDVQAALEEAARWRSSRRRSPVRRGRSAAAKSASRSVSMPEVTAAARWRCPWTSAEFALAENVRQCGGQSSSSSGRSQKSRPTHVSLSGFSALHSGMMNARTIRRSPFFSSVMSGPSMRQ